MIHFIVVNLWPTSEWLECVAAPHHISEDEEFGVNPSQEADKKDYMS